MYMVYVILCTRFFDSIFTNVSIYRKMEFFQKRSDVFMKIDGIIMIIMEILLYSDWMTIIIALLTPFFGD